MIIFCKLQGFALLIEELVEIATVENLRAIDTKVTLLLILSTSQLYVSNT